MRIRRKYPERTEMFTAVGMVLTFVTLKSKLHTLTRVQRARKALTRVVSDMVIQEDLYMYTASHSYHVMYILL